MQLNINWIITGGLDNTVRIWQIKKNENLMEYENIFDDNLTHPTEIVNAYFLSR